MTTMEAKSARVMRWFNSMARVSDLLISTSPRTARLIFEERY